MRPRFLALALSLAVATPAAAQDVMAEMHRDVNTAQQKFIDLANQALGLTTQANLNETVKFFGQDWSRLRAVVLTVTHLHEHLGQSIAYARSNDVVPPWSK